MIRRGRPGASTRAWVAKSTAWNSAARVVAIATSFVLTPYILARIGVEGYGLWVLVGAVVGYATLLDLGIAGALTKYVAQCATKDAWEEAAALVATGLRIYVAIGLLVTVFAIVLAPVVPVVFGIAEPDRATASLLVLLMGAGVGIAIPCTTASAVLRGLGLYDRLAVIRIGGTLVSAVATVAVLEAGMGVVGIAALSIPTTALMQVASIVAIRRTAPQLRFGWSGARRTLVGRIARFSGPLVVLDLAGRLQAETDEVVIGAFLPIGAITPFALAAKLSSVARVVTEQFATVLLPLASSLDAQGDAARLRSTFLTGTRVTLAIFVPIGLALGILAEPFLAAWVGTAYASAAPIVVVLVIAAGIDMAMWPAGFVLQGIARHGPVAFMALASGIANVVLSIALIGPFGTLGVALGTLIATSAEAVLLVLPYAFRTLGIRPGVVVRSLMLPTIAPAVPAGLALLLARETLEPSNLVAIAAIAAIGMLVYLPLYLASGAARAERRLARELLGGLRGAVRRRTATSGD